MFITRYDYKSILTINCKYLLTFTASDPIKFFYGSLFLTPIVFPDPSFATAQAPERQQSIPQS